VCRKCNTPKKLFNLGCYIIVDNNHKKITLECLLDYKDNNNRLSSLSYSQSPQSIAEHISSVVKPCNENSSSCLYPNYRIVIDHFMIHIDEIDSSGKPNNPHLKDLEIAKALIHELGDNVSFE